MRITAVLAVAMAYSGLIHALAQDDHPMLRELGDENKSQLQPAMMFMANTITNDVCWAKSASKTCEVNKELGNCNLPIPAPSDNYVDDGRVNKYDQLLTSADAKAYITIAATNSLQQEIGSKKTSWISYAADAKATQNAIKFTTPGLYDVKITASDYNADTHCIGCVAILDTGRPSFASCPVYSGTPMLNTLSSLKTYEDDFDSALTQSVAGGWSGTDCSSQTYTVKDFSSTASASGIGTTPSKCFDGAAQDFNIAQLKTNPFSADLQITTNADMSAKYTWKCTKNKVLKEMVDAFDCNAATTSTCQGDASCGMDLTITPKSSEIISSVGHQIPQTVQDSSKRVTDNLDNPQNTVFDHAKHIYRSVPCASFDGTDTCTFKSTLSGLIAVDPHFAGDFPTTTSTGGTRNTNDFVFYRYNIGGGTWNKWAPGDSVLDAPISFPPSAITTETYESTIYVEAWTAVGRVIQFQYDITVYHHNELKCSGFGNLFTPVNTRVVGGAYCSIPKTDFAVFHLKYQVGNIMPLKDASKVTGTFTEMKCQISAKEESDPAQPDTTSVELFSRSAGSDLIIDEDFAVQLVHNPHTAQKTTFTVTCTVKRDLNSNIMLANTDPDEVSRSLTQATCAHTFTVTDCDPPLLDETPDAVSTGACSAPALNEVCKGPLVTSTASATSITQHTAGTCCDSYDHTISCNPVGTGATSTVSRCQAVPTPLIMTELAAAEQAIFSNENLTALLGATTMVAVVALVVVKRRADATARAHESEDAYYPLLE
ncbi:hypothetical protein P3T76_002095 [Phytophthora citrophthora]|uniref:Uncharacterized protein n=1 Tax=Phytophthora citrophthora TaxID=4793 RepID=A0AAD9GXH6_9STRA|nr:hypothetical protein P3T76_002095 [Phytophthora citrophthora]